MRAPEFWREDGWRARALAPAAAAYGLLARARRARARPAPAPLPAICVGNLVAGGAGKTPVAMAIAARLRARGRTPHLIGRGYGGRRNQKLFRCTFRLHYRIQSAVSLNFHIRVRSYVGITKGEISCAALHTN